MKKYINTSYLRLIKISNKNNEYHFKWNITTHFFDNFDIREIDHLRKLELLELGGNNIKDVKLLKNFTNLKNFSTQIKFYF